MADPTQTLLAQVKALEAAGQNAQIQQGVNPSSYVGQQNGGVTGGDRSVLQILAGQNTTQVNPALQASLPDAGDQAAVSAAQQDYQSQHAAWLAAKQDQQNQLRSQLNGFNLDDIKAKADAWEKANPEPQPPDLLAIQNQSDRNRLLNEANSAYQPLIAAQLNSALGNGPSAAEATYKAAADDASRRAYGLAASAQGTGGSRAALFQAAMGQQAQQTQSAANDAAKIRAQEINQAGASVNSSLQGLTNVYGTQNLYGGTQNQQGANQNAQNAAIEQNERIAQNNANNSTDLAKSALSTAANTATHVGG